MAYDVDHSTSGTIFEYNLSHDNAGGFMLLCPYNTPTRNFTIRYNLSVNDQARIVEICDGDLIGGKIYKNSVYSGDGVTADIVLATANTSLDVLFTDNIIQNAGLEPLGWQLTSSDFTIVNNVFYGEIDPYPTAVGNITSSPRFAAPGLLDPVAYMLLVGSSALNKAVPVIGDANKDFFGESTKMHHNIGFYSGGPISQPHVARRLSSQSGSGL